MQSQVEIAENKLKDIKNEGLRQKKLLGMDIQKVEVLLDRNTLKKQGILTNHVKLGEQAGQYIERQRNTKRNTQDSTMEINWYHKEII